MSSEPPQQEETKSSSEILNELFSTFNTSFSSSSLSPSKKPKKKKKKRSKSSGGEDSGGSDSNSTTIESRIKKTRKLDKIALKKAKKKIKKQQDEQAKKSSKKLLAASTSGGSRKKVSSSSALDKIKKKKIKSKSALSFLPGSSPNKQVIGDGFVILNKSSSSSSSKKSQVKELELEDGEINEEPSSSDTLFPPNKKKSSKKKHKLDSLSESSFAKKVKLSASQAYKLDAEEKLLLGYGVVDRPSSSDYSDRDYHDHRPHHGTSSRSSTKSSNSSSSSQSDRDRGSSYRSERRRSRSPTSSSSSKTPRLAPPRDLYKSSYQKFEKQRDYTYDDRSSNNSKYDSASYYDYHAQRGRPSYSSSRGGFGYVGKSYYYDDVEDERERERERNSRDHRDYGRERSSSWRHRHRSMSPPPRRSYYHPDDIIDKSELLEIARKNAKKLMKSGVLPSDIFSRDQILAIKAGGKNVEELTAYCRRLAKRDAMGDARGSGSDDSGGEDDRGRSFIHHPFQVKDKPLPTITLNIRNSVPLPVRTPQELAIESAKLRSQFPVSSGTQHRFKEIEWKPVSEDKDGEGSSTTIVPLTSSSSTSSATGPNVCSVAPIMKATVSEEKDETPAGGDGINESDVVEKTGNSDNKTSHDSSSGLKAIEAGSSSGSSGNKDDTGISVDGPDLPLVDIGSVIGLRLKAMRLLQENPTCGDAQKQLDEATQMMKHWADAKALEPKFLTPAELSSGPQAWAKRDQLRKTRALDSGMGMHLLQKMGWKPGEGLGKNKEGQLEPLALDVKTDKKGLTAAVEELLYGGKGSGSSGGPSMPLVYDLSGKHPVSALMELTAKRRWGAPEFELCFEHGPPHKRQFVYKVIVNGVEYQPCVAVGNKKQAKANAAAFCLQSLGLLPTCASGGSGSGELLQTVEPQAVNVHEPGTSNPLKQTFGSSSFLQTVMHTEEQKQTDNDLMPPPPPPVPPPPMPPSLMNLNFKSNN